ncbi:MAG: STAS domain-containing protein [Proteobacteria bacterium]|nr:STAS domain-containing protein [Pseudomonadota bacterium]
MPKKKPLLLPEVLTAYQVGELKPLLQKAVANGQPIDGGSVSRVDTLGCQLLVSLHHSLEAVGQTDLLQNLSAPLMAAMTELGLHTLFSGDAA